jgi:hypothetical protein
MRSIQIFLLVLIIIGLGLIATQRYWVPKLVSMILQSDTPAQTTSTSPTAFDGANSTFTIDGTKITLVNGVSKVPAAPGSATMITTRYFGNEATGDLNKDGLADIAYLVTQDRGGSGMFYYAVVALKTPDGYKTTNAFLIGDRIAPQSTEIHADSGELHVNFAERKPNEPMTAQPSVGAVLVLKVTNDGVLTGLMQ